MDKRILGLLVLLGVNPSVYATIANAEGSNTAANPSFDLESLDLHPDTRRLVQFLKQRNAISIVESSDGVRLIIHRDHLDEDLFATLSKMKNVQTAPDSDDLFINQELAAGLAHFGDLDDLIGSKENQRLLDELKEKMGTKLDKAIIKCSGHSFA